MTSTIPFLDIAAAHQELRNELDAAYARVIRSAWFVLGNEVAAFEEEFAAYCTAKYCVGIGNGLDALHLILRALDIGPGDEVLVPSNTFIATWLAVTHAGATPVPVEPVAATHNIDPARIEAAVTPRTRAIIPVHLYGQPADMAPIVAAAKRHGLKVIEDAAQSHGATYHGMRTGVLGDAAAFSFYPGKNLGALGDGGAVVTNNSAIAQRVRELSNYGSRQKYVHDHAGYNTRLDELQAAFLRAKLPVLDDWNMRRAALADHYMKRLAGADLVLPVVIDAAESAWHLFVVRVKERERVMRALTDAGIGVQIHYPIPPGRSAVYAETTATAADCTLADTLSREVMSLPIGPHLSNEQIDRVCDVLLAALTAS
ncbi:DegT/DnrJ/EryC1/StrS family aminotransferase [Paraburkholderia nemoris]|uniref:DegT/DnrJ/EryC1/StrS family aminotransferase n=1 Tax=Paraburkholderia nemoris TaxID=2793076 RepID=UPI0038BCE3DB